MKVKDLKKIFESEWINDDAEVVLVGYDRDTGRTLLRDTHRCCNFEHQEKVNELWLSQEGLRRE